MNWRKESDIHELEAVINEFEKSAQTYRQIKSKLENMSDSWYRKHREDVKPENIDKSLELKHLYNRLYNEDDKEKEPFKFACRKRDLAIMAAAVLHEVSELEEDLIEMLAIVHEAEFEDDIRYAEERWRDIVRGRQEHYHIKVRA